MSDNDFDFDTDDQVQPPRGNGLRTQLEQALAELKNLREENKKLATETRSKSVASILADELKVPAKIAKFIPESVAPTREAVEKWLEAEGDVFGYTKPDPTPQAQEPTNGPDTPVPSTNQTLSPGIPQDLVDAFSRVQNAESFGGVATAGLEAQGMAQMKALAEAANGDFYKFVELQRQLNP